MLIPATMLPLRARLSSPGPFISTFSPRAHSPTAPGYHSPWRVPSRQNLYWKSRGALSTLTFRMMERDWSSMNSTRTCVTPPLEPVRPSTLVTFASLTGWAFIATAFLDCVKGESLALMISWNWRAREISRHKTLPSSMACCPACPENAHVWRNEQ